MGRFTSLLFVLVAWLTGALLPASGQPPAADRYPGLPLITNYTPTVYGAHEQNWTALEGPDGRFYFANGDGLLVYDNHDWKLITLPNKSHVRSLALSADSTLFVGGHGEMGYVRTDAYGRLQYRSLVSQLPPSERVFTRVWTTAAVGEKMYFQTSERLFVWDGAAFRVYSTESKSLRTFPLNGTLYGASEEKGLVYWTGKGFAPAPGGGFFTGKSVRIILPYARDTLLVGTATGELHLYDGRSVSPFRTGVDSLLVRHGLERGCRLAGDRFALSLGSSGLYVINRRGKLLQLLNDESGLGSNRILGLYEDRKGNLWLGTQLGISRVALGEPVRLMDRRMGLRGAIAPLVVHAGKLFVGTTEGLFVAQPDQSVQPVFRRADPFPDRIWSFLSAGPSLLVGRSDGICEWRDGRLTKLTSYRVPAAFCHSGAYPGLVWATIDDGCLAMQPQHGTWQEVTKVQGLSGSVRSLVEYRKGEVWLGTRARGVYRLRFAPAGRGLPDSSRVTVRNFSSADGLPPGDAIPLLEGGQLFVYVKQAGQLFTYQESREQFVADPGFAARLGFPNHQIATWYVQPEGAMWLRMIHPVTGKNTLVRARRQADGGYQAQAYAIPSNLSSFINSLYVAPGKAFFGGQEGVLVHELMPPVPDGPVRVTPLLTGVQMQGRPVAFRNAGTQLPFGRNAALRVHFTSPFFSATEQVSYQTRLVGFEESWSAWSRNGFKDYTNLWEGQYEFRVRAMDAYGRVSTVTGWHFAVTPPWYRRGWMYVIYLLGLASAGYGLVRWRLLRLERDNRRLENVVAERTAQLVRQHDQLRDQSEKLREMDRLKSQFFANISHEFRTPLTLIIGLAGKGQADLPPEQAHDHAVILRNAHRLLRLINQLLELSRLEAGSARLRARPADLMPFLRQIAASFASLAEQKRIRFTWSGSPFPDGPATVPVQLYFDGEKLEQVITNLLGNAFKFTPEDGVVDLSAAVVDDAVEVRVENTGPGIPAAALPYVFDRFYQADGAGSYEGTGIGLALVKELVALHHGSVGVRSIPGEQTVFTVRLPLGSRHLSPEERAEAAGPAEAPVLPAELPAAAVPDAVSEAFSSIESGRPVVLVVEDHPDLRAYLGGQFLADYQVLEAEGGEAGWQLAEAHLPDLVVSDVMMPGLNGLELLHRLKSSDKTSHIPVILLTARAGRENRLAGLDTGADDYLTKPFDAEELRVRVRNLIRTRQQLREKFTTQTLLKPGQVALPSQQQVFLDKLRRILEEHLDDALFGVEQLGEALGMSRSQIHRKVKAVTNQSPSDLIRSYRLQRAADLIRQDAGNLSEIAWQTGFSSLSHFSRSFHEEYGCSPSDFKKKYASPASFQ